MAGLFCLAAAGQNLLMNPSAETGDLSGWVILEAPGGGWSAGPGPYGLDRELDDERDGCAMFFTDGSVATDDLLWCRRSQTVDPLALGYTVGELDACARHYGFRVVPRLRRVSFPITATRRT